MESIRNRLNSSCAPNKQTRKCETWRINGRRAQADTHTHVRTHACIPTLTSEPARTHACIPTQTSMHSHALQNARVGTHTCIPMRISTHTFLCARAQAGTHAHTHTHTHICIYIHTHTHKFPRTQACTHTQAFPRAQARRHARIHIPTHTSTSTHVRVLKGFRSDFNEIQKKIKRRQKNRQNYDSARKPRKRVTQFVMNNYHKLIETSSAVVEKRASPKPTT